MNSPLLSLSKSDEIELLGETIAGLPEGYLRDILTEARGSIVSAIRNDFCFAGIGDAIKRQQAAHAESTQQLKLVETQLADRTAELRRVDLAHSSAVRQLNEARDGLDNLSRVASTISAEIFKLSVRKEGA